MINFSTSLQGSPHLCIEAGRGHVIPLCCAPFLHSFALLSTTLPMTELPGKAVEKANLLGWGKKRVDSCFCCCWETLAEVQRSSPSTLCVSLNLVSRSHLLALTLLHTLSPSPLLSPAPFPFPSQTQCQYTAAVQSATDRQQAPHTLVCTHKFSLSITWTHFASHALSHTLAWILHECRGAPFPHSAGLQRDWVSVCETEARKHSISVFLL